MAIDPPYRLDPFKNIVNVGWGGGNILVLRIDTRVNLHFPHVGTSPHETTIQDLQFAGSIDAYAETIREDDGHVPAPTIVNPTSADMRAHALMWNHAPFKFDGGEAVQTRWKAIVFLNLNRVRSFLDVTDPEYVFTIHFPEADHELLGIIYYAFWNFGDLNWDTANEFPLNEVPFFRTQEEKDNNTPHIGSNIQAFESAADRDFFISLQGDTWGAHEEASPDAARNDGLQWIARGSTYRKQNDFPLGEENAPAWDESAAIDSAQEQATSLIGTPVPAYTVTITVNLETLTVEMSKA